MLLLATLAGSSGSSWGRTGRSSRNPPLRCGPRPVLEWCSPNTSLPSRGVDLQRLTCRVRAWRSGSAGACGVRRGSLPQQRGRGHRRGARRYRKKNPPPRIRRRAVRRRPAGGAGLGDAGRRSGRSRVSSDDGEVKEAGPTPSGGEGEYYPEHQQGNGTAREQYEPRSSDPEHPCDEAQAPTVHFVGEVTSYYADSDAGSAPQGQKQTGHAHFCTGGNRRLDGEGAQRVGRRRSKPDTQSQQDKRREGYVAGSRLLDVTEASFSASGHEQDDAEGKGGAAGEGPTPANGRGDGGNGKAGEQGSRRYGRLLDAEGKSLTPLPDLSGEKEVRRGVGNRVAQTTNH